MGHRASSTFQDLVPRERSSEQGDVDAHVAPEKHSSVALITWGHLPERLKIYRRIEMTKCGTTGTLTDCW